MRELEITSDAKTKTLSYILFFVFPIFPAIHTLACIGVLDSNEHIIANMIAGLVPKAAFTILAISTHKTVIDKMIENLDKEMQPFFQSIVGGKY